VYLALDAEALTGVLPDVLTGIICPYYGDQSQS
jgi:hypothetical protein